MKALRLLAAILVMFIFSCGQTDKKTEDPASTGQTDTQAPTAPTGLVANAVSETEIELNWYAASDNVGVEGYKVFRKEGTSGASVEVGKTALTTYKSTTLNPGTQYCYQVYAYDKAGNTSTGSNEVCQSTSGQTDTTPPSAPTNLTANALSTSQVDLTWTASTDNVGVTGYRIYRNGTYADITVLSGTTTSDTGLAAATSYCYTVSAIDAAGNESIQSVQSCATTLSSGQTDVTAPSAPTGLIANAVSASQIDLT